MADAKIRAEIRATFLSAEQIWGLQSPYQPNSTWFGYLKTAAQTAEVDNVLRDFPSDQKTVLPHGATGYAAVWQLIFDLLPASGQTLLQAGYSEGTLIVVPCIPGWTPSALILTVATDPVTGLKYIYYTCTCGK